ncbi:uncharacterized protein FOMMEDRAFT_159603 [Fomitiporia mediterranea MF3/22]|uniref:uncharacterized protein n=1 Tax=Fomitiporia mediterranea (strain MF3/22) TaxID=694068 RepID=UPI0004408A2B|nr:uncharacterized protein FOMMEDRAFT_159603 [Fomitiporia mediterranea MF3/22]EJD00023.1 hypothetical protein FOMMEDRAFT_159603 [Fomitiporia mediterranea MF3/22]
MEAREFGLTNEESPIATSRIAMDIAIAAVSKRDLLGFRSGLVLPGMLKEAGFSDIRCKVYKAPLGALRAFGKVLIAEGGLGLYDTQSEVDRVIDRTTEEWNETSGVFIDFYTITARKYS